MKELIKVFSFPVACVIAMLVAFRQWRYSLYANNTPQEIADLDLTMLIASVLMAGCCVALVVIGMRLARATDTPKATRATDDKPIDTTWRVASPLVPQLPPAERISIPRYSVNGQAQPWQLESRATPPAIVETMTETGETIGVPLNYLQRFMQLPTPSRSEWSGDRAAYSAALAFCETHGLLSRDARGGAAWLPQYPQDRRSRWAAELDRRMSASARDDSPTGGYTVAAF